MRMLLGAVLGAVTAGCASMERLDYVEVPIEQLVSHPFLYDGKRVRVTGGYLVVGPRWVALASSAIAAVNIDCFQDRPELSGAVAASIATLEDVELTAMFEKLYWGECCDGWSFEDLTSTHVLVSLNAMWARFVDETGDAGPWTLLPRR